MSTVNYQNYYEQHTQQEVNWSYKTIIPLVGIPYGVVKAFSGLQQVFEGFPHIIEENKALSDHGWVKIQHGFANIIAGVVEAVPLIGTVVGICRLLFGVHRMFMTYPTNLPPEPLNQQQTFQTSIPNYNHANLESMQIMQTLERIKNEKNAPILARIETAEKELNELILKRDTFNFDQKIRDHKATENYLIFSEKFAKDVADDAAEIYVHNEHHQLLASIEQKENYIQGQKQMLAR